MAIPAADLTTNHLDAATDDPSQARVELKATVDKLNALLTDLLSGINASTLNSQAAAYYLARGNHTGTQAQSTITNLVSDLASKVGVSTDITSGSSIGDSCHFQIGNILINLGSGTVSKNTTTSVTFDTAFTALVNVSMTHSTAPQDFAAWANNFSNTGFDVTADNSSGAPTTSFHYIAIGFKS